MKIGCLAPIVLVAAAWTHAAAADDAALRQEVSALKQMVLDLQARVAYLEGQTSAAPQAAAKAPESATVVSAPQAATVASVPQTATAVSVPQTTTVTSVPQAAPPVAQSVPAAAASAVVTPRVATGSGYVSEEAALRANWTKVAKEMDEGEVTALLGDPSSKSKLDGRTVWYYSYPGTGRGSVFFTDNGRVSSRQSPFGLGW